MTSRCLRFLIALSLVASAACAGPPIPHTPDVLDVTLPTSADHVRTAVIQVLTDGGGEVEQKDDQNLTTGYREEIRGPWDGLLWWRFGTGRSRVDALVTTADEQSTRLRLRAVRGKDGLFTRWEESPGVAHAENQLRLIKNALHIL